MYLKQSSSLAWPGEATKQNLLFDLGQTPFELKLVIAELSEINDPPALITWLKNKLHACHIHRYCVLVRLKSATCTPSIEVLSSDTEQQEAVPGAAFVMFDPLLNYCLFNTIPKIEAVEQPCQSHIYRCAVPVQSAKGGVLGLKFEVSSKHISASDLENRIIPDLYYLLAHCFAKMLYLEEQKTTEVHFGLTRREKDILRYFSAGKSINEVSRELCISTNTVSSHTKSIYRKLKVNSRQQALIRARDFL